MTVVFIFYFFLYIFSFPCEHPSPIVIKPPSVLPSSSEQNSTNSRRLDDSLDHPIRIYVDYTALEGYANVTDDYKIKVKEAFDEVNKILALLLSIPEDIKNISLNELYNCDSAIPMEYHLIVDNDLVIFPIAHKGEEIGQNVIAYGGTCFLTHNTNRPFVGVVHINSEFDFTKGNAMKYFTKVIIHEMTHILGFSFHLYNFYKKSSQPVTKSILVNGLLRTVICTPKVVKVAREYYGCDSLEGVELENQGTKSSLGSHWESRIMYGEYMTAAMDGECAISEITLALLEDTGWYNVHYYTGGLFKFGKKEGCKFLNSKCVDDNNKIQFPNEFCTENDKSICNTGGILKGSCSFITTSEKLPYYYQYYTDINKGGFPFADFCPVIRYTDTPSQYFSFNCKYGTVTEPIEEIGDNSICIQHSSLSESKALCHSIKCDDNSKSIIVSIGDEDITCEEGSSYKSLSLHEGSIECPQYSKFCNITTWCNDSFECVELKSISKDLEAVTSYTIEAVTQSSVRLTLSSTIYLVLLLSM